MSCIICGSEGYEPLWKKGKGVFVKCSSCGLIYVQNREECGFAPEKKLKREVFSGPGAYFYHPKDTVPKYMRKMSHSLPSHILPYCQPPGRLLDIGCGTGYRSAVMARRGFKVYGVEPNRGTAEWGAKNFNLEMHIGYLETAPWPKQFFNVAVLAETVEHLYDPNKELKLIKSLLKKGGLLFVTTGACQDNRDFGPEWMYCEPREFYYFTIDLLVRLIEQNGFKVIDRRNLIGGKGSLKVWGRRR